MGETKWTPGPWEFGRTSPDRRMIVGGPRRKYVATVTLHQIPRAMGLHDEAEREANACLIRTSPRLYNALADLLWAIERGYLDTAPQREEARAALAQARGESDG